MSSKVYADINYGTVRVKVTVSVRLELMLVCGIANG